MANLSGITLDTTDFIASMQVYESRMRTALKTLADTASLKMEAWAKGNARWVDRTGNARQGIKGSAYWKDRNTLVCALAHQVDYGIWLELANEKRFAILEDAMEEKKDELLRAYSRLVGID